jgi:murein DD-endopeptidase MepM/ murein hydrolase activator NlpD
MISRRGEVGMRRDRLRLTFAFRSYSRTLALPRALAVVLLLLLPFAALLYLGATCYFVFHDDLLASLTRHQVEMQYAYEDRLTALRHELENATEQARADQTDFTDRIRALAQRQDQVESRTALVAALAERVTRMRIPASKPDESLTSALPDPTAEAPLANEDPKPDGKPHPEGFDLRLRKGHASSSDPGSTPTNDAMSPIDLETELPLPAQIHLLIDRYDRVDQQDLAILADLQQPATLISERIRVALASAGLAADRLSLPAAPAAGRDAGAAATGGPFVALPILSDGSSFASAAAGVENAIDTLEKLRRVLPHVPLEAPLPGHPEVTSGFGPRIDPFLGTPALHTGVDLLEDYGAPVRATAAGTVVSAGFAGGYGNMVEINHGNGLATRYAHLSSIDVEPGENVNIGTVLGRIGATGRATGPHLHYEVRIDGEPVDPERFLRAGADLLAEAAAQP